MEITKIDAAGNQLRMAIRLFFEDADRVSIHTLVSAAHGILRDLSLGGLPAQYQLNGPTVLMQTGSIIKDLPVIREEKRKFWIAKINEAQNFFKHADRDRTPQAKIHLDDWSTEIMLFDAIHMHTQVTRIRLGAGMLFQIWFFAAYPEMATHEEVKKMSQMTRDLIPDSNDKTLYLEVLDQVRDITIE